VSMPLRWEDLEGVDPLDFTIRTVPHLVQTFPDPWAGMREAAVDLAPALQAWDRDVALGLPELPYPPDFPRCPASRGGSSPVDVGLMLPMASDDQGWR